MEIKVIKNVNRWYHRSWFQWWEIIYYFRIISATPTDNYELLSEFHTAYFSPVGRMQSLRLLFPFESYLFNTTHTIVGQHATYSLNLELSDWEGFRFNPLTPWVNSLVQFRIKWTSPHASSRLYNNYPFSYRFDWTGSFLKPALRNACLLHAGDMISPLSINANSTAYFARFTKSLGFIPMTDFNVERGAKSDERRRWGY